VYRTTPRSALTIHPRGLPSSLTAALPATRRTGQVLEAPLTEFPAATLTMGHCLGAGLVTYLRAGHLEATLLRVDVGPNSIGYDSKLR
jgi:hypothetical protein